MLLNRAVSSIFLLLNTLSLAEPYAVDNNQRRSSSSELPGSDDVQIRTNNNATQINATTDGASNSYSAQIKVQDRENNHSRAGMLRHIRSRRKHHNNEFAQQPLATILPQNTQTGFSSSASRLLGPTDRQEVVRLPALSRQKRLLLNASSSLVSDPYLHRHHHTPNGASSSPVTGSPTNVKPADGATKAPPMINEITTSKEAPSYNLSNSTDPYAFSAETPQFALPTGIQILMCILYGTLAFTAITSNMIVCYIVLSNQRMRTATNYFIVNLAVGDILMALLCIPFTFPANLVFQYWPFGLLLCVVVSYSQANSVFISAYTMVAISIDKYLAIMYPMRVRMTKTQAKNIILVIWSAALITSLPTAILSRLSPAFVDLSTADSVPMDSQGQAITTTTSTTTMPSTEVPTARHPAIRIIGEQNETKPSTPTSLLLLETTTQLMEPKSSLKQEEPFTWQNKYFCQESWTFWPKGKYIYSMALMVLQFVVPLFVLVITYSRIVVVVWGKKMPGEEDNARDARMARSKRKMIKMVILCVIAFALTWLPFNVLIVIGDMRPDIWEHQNIMYIWFITHYLAMCHTITNPLIYIWMNNRFRAGFKGVISDLCRPIIYLLYYIWFHFCCLGCVLDCSRSRYLRGVSRRELKRRSRNRPTSTTVNLAQNQNNHNHGAGSGSGGGNNRSGFAATNNNTNNNTTTTNNNNNNIDGHNDGKVNHRLDNNNGNNNDTTTRNNNNTFSRSSRGPNVSGLNQTTTTANTSAAGRYSSASTSFGQAREIVDRSTELSTLQVEQPSQAGPSSSMGAFNTLDSAAGRPDQAGKTSEGSDLDPSKRSNFDFENGTGRNCAIHNRPLAGPAAMRQKCCSISGGGGDGAFESVAASVRQKLKQFFWWRHRNGADETENGQESNDATVTVSIDSPLASTTPTTAAAAAVGRTTQLACIDSRISSSTLLLSENQRKEGRFNKKKNNNNNDDDDDDDDGGGGGCGSGKRIQLQQQERERKKKKRDKQSHVISIRMTAVDYYRKPSGGSGGGCGSSSGGVVGGLRPMNLTELRPTTTTAAVGAEGHVTEASFVGCKQSKTNRKQSRQPEALDDGSRKQLFCWDEEVKSTRKATKAKMSIGRLISQHGKRQHKKRCPSCRAEAEGGSSSIEADASAFAGSSRAVPLKARDSVAKLRKKLAAEGMKAGGRFVIDLHQSSQSTTPTTSTNQTNITGLICSPANSSLMSRGSGNFVATCAVATTNEPPRVNQLANSSSISSGKAQALGRHQSTGRVSHSFVNDENNQSVSAGNGIREAVNERRSCQHGTGSLWNVRSHLLATSNLNQRYRSESHILDGAGERLLSSSSLGQLLQLSFVHPRGPLKSVEQLEDSSDRAGQTGSESLGAGRQLGRSAPAQSSPGHVHPVTNSNHSSFGAMDAMINDLDLESGNSNSRQGVKAADAKETGEEVGDQEQDQYCERHQLDQENRLHLDCELIDDQYGTDEDVGDELLSSNNHKQQTMAYDARHERDVESQANGSYEFMSDQSGGDLEDSEANLLIEYGDLDDQAEVCRTNTFRLVRLDAAPIGQSQADRADKETATISNGSHGDNIKRNDSLEAPEVIAQSSRIIADDSNNTARANSINTKYHQVHHLNRLFRSTGDNLSDGRQANSHQRLATRRARYRKLQSVANMVAMTKLAQTNKGPLRGDRLPPLAKDSWNVQTGFRDQRKSHWHQQINSPSGTDGSNANGLMMPSEHQTAMGVQPANRLVKPNRQAKLHMQQRQLYINQAKVVEDDDKYDEVSRGCEQGQRLEPIKIKFRTERKRSQEAQYDHLEQINQVRQRKQLVDANGQLVRQSSDCDHGDKSCEGLINGFKTEQSLGDKVRNSADCARNGPDEEPSFDRSSLLLACLTNSTNTPSANLSSSTQPNSSGEGPKNNAMHRHDYGHTTSCHEENGHGSLSAYKSCSHSSESSCLVPRQYTREELHEKELAVVDAKSPRSSPNSSPLGWERNNLRMICTDTAARPAARRGDAFEIGRDSDGWQQTVAKVNKRNDDEIDLQSCHPTSNGNGTAATPNVSAARAAAVAAAVKVVADEKIPFSVPSSLLVSKSPTVYLINNNINNLGILTKQQSFKTTRPVVAQVVD